MDNFTCQPGIGVERPAHAKTLSGNPRAKKMRLHDAIARQLGIAIVSGRFPPGHLLDNEIASSERLAVSRTAYREAVRILAAKGLVTARPKVGTRVNPQSEWSLLDLEVLDWVFESAPDRRLLNDLFELRKVVEGAAAGLAARRRSKAHLLAMRSALERIAQHTLATGPGRQADLDFHRALLDATQNPFIVSLTSVMGAVIGTTNVIKQRERTLRRDPVPDHRRVLEAIEARDLTGAQRAMRELIDLARLDTPGRKTPRQIRARRARRRWRP